LVDIGGRSGCVAEDGLPVNSHLPADDGCAAASGLNWIHHVTLSRDERFVYTVAGVPWDDESTLTIFRRVQRTGGVTRIGCVERTGGRRDLGCATAAGLDLIRFVTISANDRFLYTTGAQGISLFRRDTSSGAVTELATVPLPHVEDLVIDESGRRAYSASTDGYVFMFARNPKTGVLTQAQCFEQSQVTRGCEVARSIDVARSVTLSPDERFAYVANIHDGLAIFRRDPKTGRLTQLPGAQGCISETGDGCQKGRGIFGSHRLTITGDGRFAYLAGKRPGGAGSTLVTFRRNVGTGRLTELRCTVEGVVEAGCPAGGIILGAHAAILSRDERRVYVASDQVQGGIAIFARNPNTGLLSQLPGAAGCMSPSPWEGCAVSRRMGGIHYLAFTGDGRFVYAAGEQASALIVLRTDGG
jgi:6-phosphogluconolactonase (cycloisomerase 2 family)